MLPFNFDEIISYNGIGISQNTFSGYTYDSKSNSIQLNISNIDNINNLNEEDELVEAIVNAKKNSKDIERLKSQLKTLQQENERLTGNLKQNKINANNTPIIAGASGTTGMDYKGVYSHEVDNPDNMVRFQNGAIGISKNGDNEFVPIITKDGINPRFLQIPIQPNIREEGNIESIIRDFGSGGGGNGNNESGNNSTGGDTTNVINPKIKYVDLPCKIIRDAETKKVARIEYYKDGKLEYVDTLNRDDLTKKVVSIVTEHIGKETETTTLIRDEATGKVTDIDVVYINEDDTLEYAGMK